MTKLVDRFLKYVKFDTQSDELTNLTPSTPGQMVFAKELGSRSTRTASRCRYSLVTMSSPTRSLPRSGKQ